MGVCGGGLELGLTRLERNRWRRTCAERFLEHRLLAAHLSAPPALESEFPAFAPRARLPSRLKLGDMLFEMPLCALALLALLREAFASFGELVALRLRGSQRRCSAGRAGFADRFAPFSNARIPHLQHVHAGALLIRCLL